MDPVRAEHTNDASWYTEDRQDSPSTANATHARTNGGPENGPYSSSTSDNSRAARKRAGDAQPAEAANLPEKDTTAVRTDEDKGKYPNRIRGYRNAFSSQNKLRRKYPHVYREAAWVYDSPESHRHKDSMQRISRGAVDDRYISPYDARVKKLVVQTVDDIYCSQDQNTTWDRTYIRNITPWHLRLAFWPTSHLELEDDKPTLGKRALVWIKWAATTPLLFLVISFPGNAEGEIRNSGRYDPFAYRFFGYAKVARNMHEEYRPGFPRLDSVTSLSNPMSERVLLPTFLCFLNKPEESELHGWKHERVTDWLAEGNSGKALNYLFVAYTIEHFRTKEDREALHRIAEKAAREQGMLGYWIDFVGIDQAKIHDEVYRINDVVRGAKALAIAVGTPSSSTGPEPSIEELLRQWGGRLWTFPEVLLAPRGQPIRVYRRNDSRSPSLTLTKTQFASVGWEDAPVSRQLIDHFEGSLTLSPLELMQVALKCLHSRKTTQYLPGDHSYALMGLLSRRPSVEVSDSAFQAFARLSMANDSDMLLERMLCFSPETTEPEWHAMRDTWGVNLWDIYPSCQVAGIGHNDTVLLDGARAASVRWKSFTRVRTLRRDTWVRVLAKIALHTSALVLVLGGLFLGEAYNLTRREQELIDAISFDDTGISSVDAELTDPLNDLAETLVHGLAGLLVSVNALYALAGLCFAYGAVVLLVAPALLLRTYGDRLWNQQPWLFGFEGYCDLHTVERQLFGTRGRLTWSPLGSPLARHEPDVWGDCMPVDPTADPAVAALVERSKTAPQGEQRVFTLIDTHTMTATLFAAARPPVAFLLLGSEGGMQRAVGCSYDWTSGTLYPEAVLRMETSVRDLMDFLPRARLGLKRPLVRLRQAGT